MEFNLSKLPEIPEEVKVQNKEGLLKMAKDGGRGFAFYPKVENLSNLIPITVRQIIALHSTDLILLRNMLNYLFDLNQSLVSSNLSYDHPYHEGDFWVYQVPWNSLRSDILYALRNPHLFIELDEERMAYEDLFIMIWDRRIDKNLFFFQKWVRLIRYGENMTEIPEILGNKIPMKEKVQFIKKLLKKHFPNE
jgi:hypothetical protein